MVAAGRRRDLVQDLNFVARRNLWATVRLHVFVRSFGRSVKRFVGCAVVRRKPAVYTGAYVYVLVTCIPGYSWQDEEATVNRCRDDEGAIFHRGLRRRICLSSGFPGSLSLLGFSLGYILAPALSAFAFVPAFCFFHDVTVPREKRMETRDGRLEARVRRLGAY